MSELKSWQGAVEIPVELLETDPRNPNVMSDAKFTKLVSRIEQHGFDEPIQVIPHPENEGNYLILGGEHRYKAARLLGMDTVPAVIKQGLENEQDRYTELVARNIDRGDLDTARFNKLLDHLKRGATAPFTDEQIAEKMGFADTKEFSKHLLKEKKAKEAALEEVKESTGTGKNTHIIDNVSYVLNEVLNKHGQTVPMGYIFFCYKNRMHLMVQCDKDLYQLTHDLAEGLKRDNKEIGSVLSKAFEAVKKDGGFGKANVDFEYQPDIDDDLDDIDSPSGLLK